jgi:hypothetical protein
MPSDAIVSQRLFFGWIFEEKFKVSGNNIISCWTDKGSRVIKKSVDISSKTKEFLNFRGFFCTEILRIYKKNELLLLLFCHHGFKMHLRKKKKKKLLVHSLSLACCSSSFINNCREEQRIYYNCNPSAARRWIPYPWTLVDNRLPPSITGQPWFVQLLGGCRKIAQN